MSYIQDPRPRRWDPSSLDECFLRDHIHSLLFAGLWLSSPSASPVIINIVSGQMVNQVDAMGSRHDFQVFFARARNQSDSYRPGCAKSY